MVEKIDPGRAIARRIAFEESDADDAAVLGDWIEEREPLGSERVAWWLVALARDPRATAFALALGLFGARPKAVRRLMRWYMHRPDTMALAAQFTILCMGNHWFDHEDMRRAPTAARRIIGRGRITERDIVAREEQLGGRDNPDHRDHTRGVR